MSPIDEPGESAADQRPTATDYVSISDRREGFAYMPGQVLVRANGATRLLELTGQAAEFVDSREEGRRDGLGWQRAENVEDTIEQVDRLVAEGYDAQPNHVVFVHGCGSPCPPHPALAHALVRSGFVANPMGANPMGANPMGANPMGANPMQNTAIPAPGNTIDRRELSGDGPLPHIIVLDTGVAGTTPASASTSGQAIDHQPVFIANAAGGVSGDLDLPDTEIEFPAGVVVAPADNYLDPAAGHGTFIAGIIEQLAPGCSIEVRRVISQLGNADEVKVGNAIHTVVDEVELGDLLQPVIVSLSFGGRALVQPNYLREAVSRAVNAGIPVIASAGNDGVCLRQYPAAFPGVIAVAALGPDGPPPWTNYGDWVDACAPGVDLVSAFFTQFNGAFAPVNGVDPDHFSGWAKWSGTSFSVPVVVAAVVRELVGGPAANNNEVALLAAAVERVVRAPHLARLPCLGTVVNI